MELFEDFEIKPLTKGLGFHKKPISLKSEVEKSKLSDEVMPRSIPNRPSQALLDDRLNDDQQAITYEDLLKSLSSSDSKARRPHFLGSNPADDLLPELKRKKDLEFTATLPRKDLVAEPSGSGSINKVLPSLPLDNFRPPMGLPYGPDTFDLPIPNRDRGSENKISDSNRGVVQKPIMDSGVRRSSSNDPQSNLVKSPICLRSIFLDSILTVALSLVFLMTLLYITKVDLMGVYGNIRQDFATQMAMGVLFLAIYQMYVVISRSFFGRTLGEWTFDHQLGRDDEQGQGIYPLKVVLRSIIIMATGLVTLPLLSFIFRKDLAQVFSGVQLYKHRY